MPNEFELLETMWKPRPNRSTELIVPKVTYENNSGNLHNSHWAFNVGFVFRSALGLRYEQRMKNKKPYMVWTQGPIIDFRAGDLLHIKTGEKSVQVNYALPMGWDVETESMYLGVLNYDVFEKNMSGWAKVRTEKSDQMAFLKLLINGFESSEKTQLSLGKEPIADQLPLLDEP